MMIWKPRYNIQIKPLTERNGKTNEDKPTPLLKLTKVKGYDHFWVNTSSRISNLKEGDAFSSRDVIAIGQLNAEMGYEKALLGQTMKSHDLDAVITVLKFL